MVEWLWANPQYVLAACGGFLVLVLLWAGWTAASEEIRRRRRREESYRRVINDYRASQANRYR